MDENKVQPLNKLRERIRKIASNVATKVEAEKGDFKVVISENYIDQLYKNQSIGRIRVASLTEDEINYINEEPHSAAEATLDAFIESIDANKLAEIEATIKTAANSAVNDETAQIITQKQLEENNVKLHPRTNEAPSKITQKQLPEAGQRPGTYDVTTEKQFADERTTFYGEQRTAGDWKDENRTTITETQFGDGVSSFSDVATNDRNDMGAQFDGGPDKQTMMVTEKQVAELLSHHEYKTPNTTTEDQLKGQNGELGRLTAESASAIIKEALQTLGKTVLAAGATPKTVVSIVKMLVSHASKYPVVASILRNYKQADTSAIDNKVEKTRYFGKVANAGSTWSNTLVADIVLRQLAKIAGDSRHVVQALVALSETADLPDRIDTAASALLQSVPQTKKADTESVSIFKEVLANDSQPVVEGSDDDGLYEYNGALSEITASVDDEEAFVKEATAYAANQVRTLKKNASLKLEADKIHVDSDNGVFTVKLSDPDKVSRTNIEARAAKRRSMVREAQVPSGGMAPPAGGGGMGAGANPMVPPAGGDMGAPPPTEALTQPPPAEGEEEAPSGEPKPPGSICPVCGSEDVDIDNGEFNCNNCGGKGAMHVRIEVTKWPEVLQESSGGDQEEGGFGLGEGLGSEDAALGGEAGGGAGGAGEETTMPNVPVAASVRLTPLVIEKLASQKIQLGSVCPNCGGHNTDLVASTTGHGKDGICWKCLTEYNLQVKADKSRKHAVYAQFMWTHGNEDNCSNCNRLKTAFVRSLKNYGMTWNQFRALSSMKDQGEVILKMAKSGVLNLSEAMSADLPLEKFAASNRWNGYQKFDKFPSATCQERIARRFGENATAMSGPCEGKKLHECVCSQLEGLGIYTDGLAAKVASHLASTNPMINNPSETCVGMFVRDGYSVKEACTMCEGLRAAYASTEDLIVEAVANSPIAAKPAPAPMAPPAAAPMGGGAPAPQAPSMGMPSGKPQMKKQMPGPEAADPMNDPVMEDDEPMDLPDEMGEMGEMEEMGNPEDSMNSEPEMGPEGDMGSDMDSQMNEPSMNEPMPGESPMGGNGPMETADMVNILVDGLEDIVNALRGDIKPEMGPEMGGSEMGGSEMGSDMGGPEMGSEMGGPGMGSEVPEPLGEGDDLDMGEVTDGVVDDDGGDEFSHNEATETPEEEAAETPEMQEQEEESGFEEHQAPEESESEEEEKEEEGIPGLSEDDDEDGLQKESNPMKKEKEAQALDKLLYAMKSKTMKRSADALDSLFDGLMRQAEKAKGNDDIKKVEYKTNAKEKKVTVKPAQDTPGIKVQDGGKMGGEKPFKDGVNSKPDVPRAKGTLGEEESDATINETGDMPSVPAGGDAMEGEKNYDAEKSVVVDGNQGGQKAASVNLKKK